MQGHKPHQFRPPLTGAKDSQGRSNEAGGTRERDAAWDAYRRWLTSVGEPAKRRTPADNSVYSWKGYHSWAERIRQNWKADS